MRNNIIQPGFTRLRCMMLLKMDTLSCHLQNHPTTILCQVKSCYVVLYSLTIGRKKKHFIDWEATNTILHHRWGWRRVPTPDPGALHGTLYPNKTFTALRPDRRNCRCYPESHKTSDKNSNLTVKNTSSWSTTSAPVFYEVK